MNSTSFLEEAAKALGPDAMSALGMSIRPSVEELQTLAHAMLEALRERPEAFEQRLTEFYTAQFALWQTLLPGSKAGPAVDANPPPEDSSSHGDWSDSPWFRYARAQHELWSRHASALRDLLDLRDMPGRRLAFLLRQSIEASDPDNFFVTNPDAIRRAIATQGESVARGLRNLAQDIERGSIRMSDEHALALGRDIAATAGHVVWESPIAQLIQYRPITSRVRARPLVIVPPFINKYYILDLRPENSFVRFALASGFQVFLVSWRNGCAETAASGWDDYVRGGVLEAMRAAGRISRTRRVNLLGYCVGGTLCATAAALVQPEHRAPLASLTLLTTLLDFKEPGELGVFVDDAFLHQLEAADGRNGLMPARHIAAAFSSLRARELVWHFVERNYLFGETPPVMDLLHWNSDGADVPAPLFSQYLRKMYLENTLVRPGTMNVLGEPVDLSKIGVPSYMLAAIKDHIVPWQSAYRGLRLLSGDKRFVLTESGHVAGVVNPPGLRSRGHWVSKTIAGTPEEWFHGAEHRAESWWTDWAGWLASHSGAWKPAPSAPGGAGLAATEAAPGRYVQSVSGRRAAAGS